MVKVQLMSFTQLMGRGNSSSNLLYGTPRVIEHRPTAKLITWPQKAVDNEGTIIWRNLDGQLHRRDGPAIEWANGDKEWWLNDQHHREDGPAVERANGDKEWWL